MKLLISIFLLSTTSLSFANLIDLQSWVAENHIKETLSTTLSSDLATSLSKDIPGNKFVFVGEADHYYHEKYTYRLAFIKELLKLGYYHIYAELGVADGMRVNSFLETGDENFLKQVGLYGFSYGKPLEYREGAFVAELVRYFKELRKLKLKYPKLTYGGFDLDMNPGTAYLDFDQFAARSDVQKFSKINKSFFNALNFIEKAKKENNLDLVRLKINVGYSQALAAKDDAAIYISDYDQFLFYYKVFKDSLTFGYESKKVPLNWGVFEWREERMFEIMTYILKNEKPNSKYILLGHNGHLIKSDAKNSQGKRYTTWNTIGAWITNKFPNSVFAIWNLIGRGEHRGHGCPGRKTCTFELKPNTLEENLYEISSTKSIYFKNNLVLKQLEDEIKTVVNGSSVVSGKYGDYADAFYFIPEVTDLKP